jgi:uncharacterized membrane protein
MYSKIKIFGHPVHPMLVAFPVAAYTGTLAAFAIYDAMPTQFWLNMAIALNVVGVCSAALAALPGALDWLIGIPMRSSAKVVGLFHAVFNVFALGLFLASVDFYASNWNGPLADPVKGLTLSGAGVLCTLVAGGLGWRLVQTFHVGVHLTPQQELDEPGVKAASPIPHRQSA